MLDIRISVLKKTKVNKIKNQSNQFASSATNAVDGAAADLRGSPDVSSLTGALGGLPDVNGLARGLTSGIGGGVPGLESLTGAIGGLTGELGRRKRELKKFSLSVNQAASALNNIQAKIPETDGVAKVPKASNGLNSQQKLVGNLKRKY